MDKKIIVIDLDGTFVSVNTFHKWMKFVALKSLQKLYLISIIKIFWIIFRRAIKSINHGQMKFAILKISEKTMSALDIEDFVKSLDKYVHQDILKHLKNPNYMTILATAAPQIYAKKIQEVYAFNYEVSTPVSSQTPWKENLKETKKQNVLKLLKEERLSLNIDILFTDHHDDLPLMKYAKETYLVGASEKTLKILKEKSLDFESL
ncbi:MAG: HAD family hydrolase [Sulfurovum sp.]|nr:HAD family hydrolase [Sulfurovum sp.]